MGNVDARRVQTRAFVARLPSFVLPKPATGDHLLKH